MGVFYSYCEDCNSRISWFVSTTLSTCEICGKDSTPDELTKSLYNEKYWIIEKRKKKINKIRKNIRNS